MGWIAVIVSTFLIAWLWQTAAALRDLSRAAQGISNRLARISEQIERFENRYT